MASRRIQDLHPDLQPICLKFLEQCNAIGIDILITCTFRSWIEQEKLFAIGRSLPGRKVTNARPGQSKHNNMIEGRPASTAFDIVPMRNGKPIWNAKDPVWQQCGEIGVGLGLEWAGNWTKFVEFPHFQLKE